VTDSFWRDPPWRGGKGGYRMGLRPIEPGQWLPDRITDGERARKQRLLADPEALVFAALDNSDAGQQKILDAVDETLGCSSPQPRDSTAPLVTASLLVPDDLCLMERDGDAYRLTAACVCSPSYWLLAEKIGRTLNGIHGPVPTLNDKLGAAMLQFFARLPDAAVYERRNWLMHTNPEPYQPRSETWHDVTRDDVETLIIRSERQTLRRLDSHTVAFSIRVTCHPLMKIAGFPEAARDLLAALDALDPAEREAKGHRYFAPAVTRYLRSVI
jgi:hypothetical protein